MYLALLKVVFGHCKISLCIFGVYLCGLFEAINGIIIFFEHEVGFRYAYVGSLIGVFVLH